MTQYFSHIIPAIQHEDRQQRIDEPRMVMGLNIVHSLTTN